MAHQRRRQLRSSFRTGRGSDCVSLLSTVYILLCRKYVDLGANHFERLDRFKTANRLLRKLDELGFVVGEIYDNLTA
jgi:hypothetical protein